MSSLLTLATVVAVVVALVGPISGSGHASTTAAGTVPTSTPTPGTGPTPAPTTGPTGAPASHIVLALGDSVPSGAACGCSPYPKIYGALLSQQTGAHVTVDDRAVSGQATTGLITQLSTPAVQDAVRRADVLQVEIGANDFNDHRDQVDHGQCQQGGTDCASADLDALRVRLNAVLARIRALRAGQPTTILVMGYWNVFQDGDVARRAYGDAGLQASLTLTRRANAVISSVSAAQGACYVDIFKPFEESGRDVTSLLAPDGDHPDAGGHELIARTLLAAGLPRTG